MFLVVYLIAIKTLYLGYKRKNKRLSKESSLIQDTMNKKNFDT